MFQHLILHLRNYRSRFIIRRKRFKYHHITGNTAIDALQTTVRADYTHEQLEWAKDSRLILITAHRRENLGEPKRHMFRAIKCIVEEHQDIKVIYPVHMNPVVRETANEILGNDDRIRIIEPLEVLDFHNCKPSNMSTHN